MKKQIFSLLVCTAVLLGGCVQQVTTQGVPSSARSVTSEMTLPAGEAVSLTNMVPAKRADVLNTMSSFADWAFHYSSPAQMLNDERIQVVVEGTVLSSEFVNLSNDEINQGELVPKTKSILKIEHVYKGDLEIGDEICVVECGGFVPAKLQYDLEHKAKFENAPDFTGPDGVVEYRTCGYKVCEAGESVILFLEAVPAGAPNFMQGFYVEAGETYYTVANDIQGKYLLSPGRMLTRDGEAISTDGCYLPYITEDMIDYEDTVFTLDSFEEFVKENLKDKSE